VRPAAHAETHLRILLLLTALLIAVFGVGFLLRLLNPLPKLAGRTKSTAPGDTADTRLGRAIIPDARAHPGLSGVLPLSGAREAFAARVLLIRAADLSIDLQYYIWQDDISGNILFDETRKAADRGVRVRLLLDDNGIAGLDRLLAALDAHPNIEVRLFNPFIIRRPKALGYFLDFSRLNRRMHNKSITVDNQATIVGGRNIGDAYFGASREDLFADLDVLAIGAIVPAVSADFDRYWSSDSAYPAASILPPISAAQRARTQARVQAGLNSALAREYAQSVAENELSTGLTDGTIAYEWVPVAMVSDDPSKGLGKEQAGEKMMERLGAYMGHPREKLALVSAYFVPTDVGTAAFAMLARSGVDVSILTNALNATDVAVVHAGYAKHRRALLQAGVKLWEMKGPGRSAGPLALFRSGSRSGSAMRFRPLFRFSGSSLHAKTFTTDGKRLFVGSFNFDPRSVHLNTELGFVIESESLSGQLQSLVDEGLDEHAYKVRLRTDGKGLEWVEKAQERVVIHTADPGSSRIERAAVAVLSRLPIDWML